MLSYVVEGTVQYYHIDEHLSVELYMRHPGREPGKVVKNHSNGKWRAHLPNT